jgi:hypothetical protein
MLVFLSWLETDNVIKWWEDTAAMLDAVCDAESKADQFARIKAASPELQVLLKQFENPFKLLQDFKSADPFNYALLATRITVPQKNKSAKYSLATRFPGTPDAKPPISLACKSFFSATFPDLFMRAHKPKPENDITFVSFKSNNDFCRLLVNACAVLDSPIPYGMDTFEGIRHIQICETEALGLVKAYAHNNRQKLEQTGTLAVYDNLANQYCPGAGVDNSSILLLTAAQILGIVDSVPVEK